MRRFFVAAVAFAAFIIAAPATGLGQTLSTAAPNNGSGGVFMDLTPSSMPLFVNSFATPFSGTAGTVVEVEVWTRPGSYVGFDDSSAGWSLTQTVSTIRQGTTTNSPIVLTSPILLPEGQTTAVYLHAINHSGAGIRYTGTSANPPQTTWSNADLTLFSDVARTGAIPFAGGRFTPRTFSGDVNYSPVPEPTAALGLLGLGGLMLRRRRA